MLKHAFQSYIMSLHPKRKMQVKEQPKSFLISFICAWLWIGFFSEVKVFVVLSKVLPLLLIRWSNLVIGAYMGKAMLLCPMKQESRKEYINYMLAFKIGCPVMLGFLIEMFWGIVYGFDLKRTVLFMVIYISFGIAETIHIDGIDKMDNRIISGRKDKSGNVKFAVQNLIVSIIAAFLLIGNYGVYQLTGEESVLYPILNDVGIVILIVLDIVIFFTQYKDMIEETVDYELAFHVPGRLHYIKNE